MPFEMQAFFSNLIAALVLFLSSYAAYAACALFLGLWAYRDAKRRNLRTPAAYGLLVAMVPYFIGLIVYMCTRPDTTSAHHCASCGAVSAPDNRYCTSCGGALEAGDLKENEGKAPKPMLIGFFISLGLYVVMIALAITMYITGIFNMVRDATYGYDNYHGDYGNYRYGRYIP